MLGDGASSVGREVEEKEAQYGIDIVHGSGKRQRVDDVMLWPAFAKERSSRVKESICQISIEE